MVNGRGKLRTRTCGGPAETPDSAPGPPRLCRTARAAASTAVAAAQSVPEPFAAAAAQARRSRGRRARPVARGGPAPWAGRDLDSAGSGSPGPPPRPQGRDELPGAGNSRRSPRCAAASCTLRQKLIFSPCSDCEEEEEEEEEGSGHSTGEDSAFQEPDLAAAAREEPHRARARGPSLSGHNPRQPGEPGGHAARRPPRRGRGGRRGRGRLVEEEGFGSSSPVKSPAAPYFLGSSFSPVRCGGPGDASLRGCGARGAGEGACSPLPDYPGTPPHKTFRKLRLFDTPHTPQGEATRPPGCPELRAGPAFWWPRRRERSRGAARVRLQPPGLTPACSPAP